MEDCDFLKVIYMKWHKEIEKLEDANLIFKLFDSPIIKVFLRNTLIV